MVECKYLDPDGKCTWRYEGYKCIEDKCSYYIRITTEECEYLRDDGYCKKYNRFYCAGVGNCDTQEEYNSNMEKDGKKKSPNTSI